MQENAVPKKPVAFDLGLPTFVTPFAKWVLGLGEAEKIYADIQLRKPPPSTVSEFCRTVLAELKTEYAVSKDDLEALRKINGPLIFISNHPFGGLDALVLMAMMGEVRAEFQFMATSILSVIPELLPALVSVDILEKNRDPRANIAPLRKLYRSLSAGGMLGMFPSGEVATFDSWRARTTVERPWNSHLGRIVHHSRATVVPVFIEGRNSLLFQYVGLAVPMIRIALLSREILRPRPSIVLRIGKPIPYWESQAYPDPGALTLHFRERTFSLGPDWPTTD